MSSAEDRAIFSVGDRISWQHSNPDGWPGDGLATIVGADPERAFFGAERGTGRDTPGFAYKLRLDRAGFDDVWVSPCEFVAALTPVQ